MIIFMLAVFWIYSPEMGPIIIIIDTPKQK